MENTTFKLGKLAPKNSKSLSFGDFVTSLPSSPLIDLAPTYAYPMFGNSQWGDCVCADEGHSQQVVTGLLTGTMTEPTLAQVEQWYETQNPSWTPASGSEGNGMDMQTFLEYLTAQKKVLGFARIDFRNQKLLQSAIYVGLAVKLGVQLQQAQAGAQFNEGLWDYVPGSPTVGGHDVCLVGYDATTRRYSLVSWGKLIECTQAFIDNLADECWFPLRPEHVSHPSFRDHFDVAGFATAVSEITSGKVSIPAVVPTAVSTLTITRTIDNGRETLSTCVATRPDGSTWSCDALELPWKQNVTNVSCIPPGTYQCSIRPFHATTNYEVLSVPGRSGIFMHVANYVSQLEGCIALGATEADINADGLLDVTSSTATIAKLREFFNNGDFTLTIK